MTTVMDLWMGGKDATAMIASMIEGAKSIGVKTNYFTEFNDGEVLESIELEPIERTPGAVISEIWRLANTGMIKDEGAKIALIVSKEWTDSDCEHDQLGYELFHNATVHTFEVE